MTATAAPPEAFGSAAVMAGKRQRRELLHYIATRLKVEGISPSFREMAGALGLKSTAGVDRLISSLEERGFIRRPQQQRARAIEIIRLPGDVTDTWLAAISNEALLREVGRRGIGSAA